MRRLHQPHFSPFPDTGIPDSLKMPSLLPENLMFTASDVIYLKTSLRSRWTRNYHPKVPQARVVEHHSFAVANNANLVLSRFWAVFSLVINFSACCQRSNLLKWFLKWSVEFLIEFERNSTNIYDTCNGFSIAAQRSTSSTSTTTTSSVNGFAANSTR